MMKRLTLSFMFVLAMICIAPVQANAFQVTTNANDAPIEGCAPEAWETLVNAGYGYPARKMTAGWQLINPPSSVHALTCGDQSLMASSKAGAKFSDTAPAASQPFNPAVSIGLGSFLNGPFGPGTSQTLMSHVSNVVDPMLGNLLSNGFQGLTSAIGSTLSSVFGGIVSNLTSGVPGLGSVISGLMGQNFDCDIMQQTWNNLITGQGPDEKYSFIPMDNFLDRNNLPASLGAAALAQLAANAGIIDQIKNDRENLRTPGYYSFMPVSPSFPAKPSLDEVIQTLP